MAGKKTGKSGRGRPKGSPNRRTKEVLAHLHDLNIDCDPITFLARVVANDYEALGLKKPLGFGMRMRAAEALAPYTAPKRKAVEVTTQGGATPVIIVPEKSMGGSWAERAQTIREEQQRVLQERLGKATT